MESELPEKYKDISRIDQEKNNSHGWYVRVRFEGEYYNKFFSDSKYQGREDALAFALEWRNAKEKELGKPRSDRYVVTNTHSNTGVIGVTFNEKEQRYEANWVEPDGKLVRKVFSVTKHGDKGAFKKAIEIRRKKDLERLHSNI